MIGVGSRSLQAKVRLVTHADRAKLSLARKHANYGGAAFLKNTFYAGHPLSIRQNNVSPLTSASASFVRLSQNNQQSYSIIYGYGNNSVVSRRCLSMTSSKKQFHYGDVVKFDLNGEICSGKVQERKGGWYTIVSGGKVVKKRASQMTSARLNTSEKPKIIDAALMENHDSTDTKLPAENGGGLESLPFVPESFEKIAVDPPTIIDIDATLSNQSKNSDKIMKKKDLLHLQQCSYFAKYKDWVVFTDLHCAPSSLDTCLTVLSKVHTVAKERGAGILFLGDFWHHRGNLRVDCLNAVLNALSEWEVPMIMIPGNHDQVTLGGSEHSLTPLQNAYFLSNESTFIPGILIFTNPTKYLQGLFVPHIREVGIMQSILQSNTTASSDAIFLHADITGASMNENIVSTFGTAPSYFPPHVPIYTGHFHKPHYVYSTLGACIRYVGSPYQTTLAEAGQNKSLLVLDAQEGWKCVEEIPLDIGRKHWTINSVEEFLSLSMETEGIADSPTEETKSINGVASGDRVVVSVLQDSLEIIRRNANKGGEKEIELMTKFDNKVKALRSLGVSIEIREIKPVANIPTASALSGKDQDAMISLSVEDMSPSTTWSNYLANEVKRGVITNETSTFLLKAGSSILENIDGKNETITSDDPNVGSKNSMDLCLESVTIKGFGPFEQSVTYPLKDRGLVLLCGSSSDLGSDSNGSGKTSLAMAALWVLTGSSDPRPFGNANTGSSVVNDSSKCARVSLSGTINNQSFVISRSRTTSKTSLTFLLEGIDLTRQSVKDTQAIIYEKLGTDSQMLSRTIFHGQHSINGLLESTDTKLKEELSLILPLALWQKATERARSKRRIALKKVAELDGMLTIRQNDVDAIVQKCNNAKEAVSTRKSTLKTKEQKLHKQMNDMKILMDNLPTYEGDHDAWFKQSQRSVEEAAQKVQLSETFLTTQTSDMDITLKPLREEIKKITQLYDLEKTDLQGIQYQLDRSEFASASAVENLNILKKKWNISDMSNEADESFILPEVSICPTCQQPFTEEHSHEHVLSEIKASFNAARSKVEISTQKVSTELAEVSLKKAKVSTLEMELDKLTNKLQQHEAVLLAKLSTTEETLQTARMAHMEISANFSNVAKQMNYLNELKNIEKSSAAEIRRYMDNVKASQEMYDDISKERNELENEIRTLKAKREDAHCLSVTMSNLADNFGARGVQTFILQNTVHALQITSQSYLDELSDGAINLRIKLDDGDRIVRDAAVLNPDGTWIERPLSSLSGGQWRRCSLALSLGFSDLVARRGRLRSSILVLDEPLTHLDSVGRDDVGKVLRKILHRKATDVADNQVGHLGLGGLSVSTILIILQDLVAEELSESFDCIDEVVKRQGKSEVFVDGVGSQ